jgi:predicted nuclease of predicted toxin-antitoxin system
LKLWLDVHLSPAIATWLAATFQLEAICVRDLGLTTAEDQELFMAARAAGASFVTKDADFAELVQRLGSPPHVIWVRCGNSSNARMREVLTSALPRAIELISQGEALIEIIDAPRKSG